MKDYIEGELVRGEPEQGVQFTDEYLGYCITELQNMITACQSAIDGKSFAQSCRDVNLDPEKTDTFLRHKLMRMVKIQDPGHESSYDGYKHFYLQVFGEQALERMALPSDYKEAVNYVVKHSGLSEKDSYLLQMRFGIGDRDMPTAIKNMTETAAGRNRISADIRKALSLCRYPERASILKHGFEEPKRQRLAEARQKRMDDMSRAMLEKQDVKVSPDEIRDYLRGVPIRELGLVQPTADALKESGIRSLYDVFSMTDDDIEKLPVKHDLFRSEIRTSREMYAASRFGTTAAELMDMLPEDDFSKAVESISQEHNEMLK